MSKIKTKDIIKGTIKTLDKTAIATERTKEVLVNVKEKSENAYSPKQSSNEYASNRVSNSTNRITTEIANGLNKSRDKSFIETKKNIIKTKNKIKKIKGKLTEKKNISKVANKGIKTADRTVKTTKKVAKETIKATERARKLAVQAAKKTYQGVKLAVKATIATVKAIIAATKALIAAIIAGGWVAVLVIVVICLVGLLCSSIYGIFFSGEKASPNSMSMQDVIIECNEEFSNKLQTIQDQNIHEEYVLNGSMASWKDILLIYAVKQSNGLDGQEVVTMNSTKKQIVKDIFWDMNTITYEVETEIVKEQGINIDELPKDVQKQVLHITITSQSAEDMIKVYSFNTIQQRQFEELSSDDYAGLWNGIIYGLKDNGEYIAWRQNGATWSNIRIGNTTSTISDIGCLVTSISVLIEKSGVNDTIKPFNPGTFVEALNKNHGFDNNGNLQYTAVNKVVPRFKYVGNIDLKGKTKSEKLLLITKYFNNGYYIAVEVKGATPGNQHWVAITGINRNSITIVDPGSNQTDLWNAYKYANTSQFNYFKAD